MWPMHMHATYIIKRRLDRFIFLERLLPHLVKGIFEVQDLLHPSKSNVDGSRC